ncbi:SDR family NAD(P)-dependent oxidoreductase [Nitratireductor basaltis]|uniref:Short-chain dehydrogenase/reductase SDR n=1 Tax=Nitratireductor basaltis TaxID=472175 RepID=A0A084UCK1_9HYPH|nr:SDR family NAD(P)-dependent oxidoreductase [Nitratireductor basaltis]KFB10687.1 Short-chain dehydrogenase/reductase SDR [Nitratireductor basaltis]
MTSIHVITGATSGLGLAIARRLASKPGGRMIAGARRPESATELKRTAKADRIEVLALDTSSLASVRNFVSQVRANIGSDRIASVICVAGLQPLGPRRTTADGFDEVFATNVLGHIALVDGLLDRLAPNAAVITIGSGTHDPSNKLAARAGFMGADFTDAKAAAAGRSSRRDRDEREQALDRYATSKLCAIYHATAAATEKSFADARFYCFDPGLMPGTSLAREQNASVQFVWKRLMPVLRHFVEGVSSPEISARLIVDDLVPGDTRYRSGSHIEFTGKVAPASQQANDLAAAKRFLEDARALLAHPPRRSPPGRSNQKGSTLPIAT